MGTTAIVTPEPQSLGDVYRHIVEQSADPLLLAVRGRMVVVSPSIEAALGWTPAELEHTQLVDMCHPDDRESLVSLMERAIRGGTHRGVFQMHAKGDGLLWVLVTLRAPEHRADDHTLVGSLREINLRVENESELRSERNRYRALAQHASDVVIQTAADTRITWVSDSVVAHAGWQPQDLIGRTIEQIVDPSDIEVVRESRAVIDSGRASRMRVRMRTASGAGRWFAVLGQAEIDESGAVVGRISGWRDIQAEIEAQERLDEALRQAEESEALMRAALDAMLDPQVTLKPVSDQTGTIVDFRYADANLAACEYLGMSREQLLKASLLGLMPGLSASGLFALCVACIRFGTAIVLDGFQYGNEVVGGDRYYDLRGTRAGDRLMVTWRDVTERMVDTERVAASEQRYRLIAENASDVVVHLRDDGVVRWVSPSIAVTLGWQPAEWLGQGLVDFVHAADRERFVEDLGRLRAGAPVTARVRLAAMSDGYRWVELRARPYRTDDGVHEGSVASLRDVDAQVASEVELERLARIDSLTGLVNRAQAVRRLEAVSADNRRLGQLTGALFCDVDRFKEVNDTHGHAAGDAVLQALAHRLTEVVRRDDVVARMGGDEILIILDGVRDLADAVSIGEKVRDVAALPIPFGGPGGTVQVTMSVGATIALPDEAPDAFLARADDAMYEAKRRGRDQVVPIEPLRPC